MSPTRVGILGGSGLYKMPGITDVREVKVKTPFGDPSDSYFIGKFGTSNVEVVFLPRHGRGHTLLPTEVPSQANIFGFKVLNCSWVIAVSAVGSLSEKIDKGHVILVDQFIDKTKHRKDTFFGNGIVAHVPFSEPCCATLRKYLLESCNEVGAAVHEKGTYVNMEGPAFSTYAESMLHRSWGGDIIGMTAVSEAKLCREAEISYGLVAMVTDFDCWKTDEEAVSVEAVIATLQTNVLIAQKVIQSCIPKIAAHQGKLPQEDAMFGAIMTSPDRIPPKVARDLAPLIRKYRQIPADETEGRLTSLLLWGALTFGLKMLPSLLKQ